MLSATWKQSPENFAVHVKFNKFKILKFKNLKIKKVKNLKFKNLKPNDSLWHWCYVNIECPGSELSYSNIE